MGKKIIALIPAVLTGLLVIVLTAGIFSQKAYAQDFYGEGNVLIAVDMGQYAEDENVHYSEGTMGTLIWGDDAPTGVSTRAPFEDYTCTVSDDVTAYKCPDYKIETVYHVGQKCFLPYWRYDDPDYCGRGWLSADAFPREVIENDEINLLYNPDCIRQEDQDVLYKAHVERISEEEYYPCYDFLEIECVGISEYGTVWRYNGTAYSTRTGFDISDYGEVPAVDDEQIKEILDAFDKAYIRESEAFGDPRIEDYYGDRDGKAACILLDCRKFLSALANYQPVNTDIYSFDSIFVNLDYVRENVSDYYIDAGYLRFIIMHEFNHYIMSHSFKDDNIELCAEEYFADYSFLSANPDKAEIFMERADKSLACISSRLRLIPGMLWGSDHAYSYPKDVQMANTLGAFFLSYVEKFAAGRNDGRFWTEFFSGQIPGGNLTNEKIDGFLTDKTGYGLNDWLARFLADVVTENEEAWSGMKDFIAQSGIVQSVFLRPYEEYGKITGSFESAADEAVIGLIYSNSGLYAVRGGGTTYAYRNDAGGRIAITGADDDWYFFAVNMDLPDTDKVIEISSSEELARIGNDRDYPLYGNYSLTRDIDLGGDSDPWKPIGSFGRQFTGQFEGNGHTISGLYVNAPEITGLFGYISGNAVIRNLTVSGSVTGKEYVGGIAGLNDFATISNCTGMVSVSGTNGCGGITGYNNHGTVSDCTNLGSVSGVSYCGGITGYDQSGIISECTVSGKVIGNSFVGGITGTSSGSVLVKCHNGISGIHSTGGVGDIPYLVNKTGKAKLLHMNSDTADLVIKDYITVSDESYPVAYIRKNAIKGIKKLQSVTMGENIIAIGKNAFRGDSQLKNIELTGSVIRIGKNAFKGISDDALFKIRASEEDFERVVALIKAAGVKETVVFERIEP